MMQKKVSDFTSGMINYGYCFNTELLFTKGFSLIELITLEQDGNVTTDIEIMKKDDIKVVKVTSEKETLSEGTLVFNSFFIYEKDKAYFNTLKNMERACN